MLRLGEKAMVQVVLCDPHTPSTWPGTAGHVEEHRWRSESSNQTAFPP